MANLKMLANQLVKQAIDEIETIQRCAIVIASSSLETKLTIYKRSVDQYVLMKIAEKFASPIIPKCPIHLTPAYVNIKMNSCNIIIQLETKK